MQNRRAHVMLTCFTSSEPELADAAAVHSDFPWFIQTDTQDTHHVQIHTHTHTHTGTHAQTHTLRARSDAAGITGVEMFSTKADLNVGVRGKEKREERTDFSSDQAVY